MDTTIVLVAVCASKHPERLRSCLDCIVQQLMTSAASVSILVTDTVEGKNYSVFAEYEKSSPYPLYYEITEWPLTAILIKARDVRARITVIASEFDTFEVDWLATFLDKAMMIIPDTAADVAFLTAPGNG